MVTSTTGWAMAAMVCLAPSASAPCPLLGPAPAPPGEDPTQPGTSPNKLAVLSGSMRAVAWLRRLAEAEDEDEGHLQPRTARMLLPAKPFYCCLVALGVVPVAVRPWRRTRLSFHPLRSTLGWALAVHSTGLLSTHYVWTESLGVLRRTDSGGGSLVASTTTFLSLLAIAQTAGYVLLVSVWAEAWRYREVVALFDKLASHLRDDDLLDWPNPRTFYLAVMMAFVSTVYMFGVTVIWQFILAGPGEVVRLPAHWLANVCITAVVGGFVILYSIIEDIAHRVGRALASGLANGPVDPGFPDGLVHAGLPMDELVRCSQAWLALRDLVSGSLVMPVSVTLFAAWVVVNNLLCLYHVLNMFLSGAPFLLVLSLLVMSVQVSIGFIAICLAADRAVSAVRDFSRPLESLDPSNVACTRILREVFHEALAYPGQSINVAGFWCVNRRTVTSFACISITYLIVLVEFRTEEKNPSNICNCSCAT